MEPIVLPGGVATTLDKVDGNNAQSDGASVDNLTVGVAPVDSLARVTPDGGVGSLGLAATADGDAGSAAPGSAAPYPILGSHTAGGKQAADTDSTQGLPKVEDAVVGGGAPGMQSASVVPMEEAPAASGIVHDLSVFATSNGNLTFNLVFDAAAQAAGTTFMADVTQAATLLSAAISVANPITVNMDVGNDENGITAGSGSAEGGPGGGQSVAYSTVTADLLADKAAGDTNFDSLPNATSIQGETTVDVWNAELKAFGILPGNNAATDGSVTFDYSGTFAVGGNSDSLMVGVALHELAHALGRVPNGPTPDIFDFFRFTTPGTYLFSNATPSASAYFSVDGGTTNLVNYGINSDPSDFLNSGTGVNDPFAEFYGTGTKQTLTSLDLTQLDVLGFNTTSACYCRGTLILTDTGEVAVEDLAIGDRVVTLSGAARRVRWLGHRGYDGRFITGNREVLPICITADALADGVPTRDLWLSPEHSLYLDGVLVQAMHLVNGATIVQPDAVERVEYFHIELDTHDVIFAEGAPAETFIDCDNRLMFANAAEYAQIYPEDGGRPRWQFCLPRLEWGADELIEIRAALLWRAESLGCDLDADPELNLVADGEIIRPSVVADDHYRFAVPAGCASVWLASRHTVPAESVAASQDHRRLGVPVERILLSDGDLAIEVGHGHAQLRDGFHDNEATHRWTDGMARIPADLLRLFAGDITLEVRLTANDLRYPMEQPRRLPFSSVPRRVLR
jgi:Hint domain